MDKTQLHRLHKNMVVKIIIRDRLCGILDCHIEDIMEYVPDEEPGEGDFNCGKAQPGGNRVCAPYGGADT